MAIKIGELATGIAFVLITTQAFAQVDFDAMLERGEALYKSPASCSVCHKETGEGLIGPDIRYGPTAAQILEQLQNNPQMAIIAQELKADNDDLMAVAIYIRKLGGLETNEKIWDGQLKALSEARARTETDLIFPKTERDIAVEAIQNWESAT